jgi:hypothetical protein
MNFERVNPITRQIAPYPLKPMRSECSAPHERCGKAAVNGELVTR